VTCVVAEANLEALIHTPEYEALTGGSHPTTLSLYKLDLSN
jgi:hypothetical protein